MRSNPNNPIPNIIIMDYEITLGFNHTNEPNQIVSTVEHMLREIGLPKAMLQSSDETKSA